MSDLFPSPAKPRQKPRVMMRMIDAGPGEPNWGMTNRGGGLNPAPLPQPNAKSEP